MGALLYGAPLFKAINMAVKRTISTSVGVTLQIRTLLEVAAAHDYRSLTKMLETLLSSDCEQRSLKESAAGTSKAMGAMK